MRRVARKIAIVLLVAFLATILVAPLSAMANVKGKRNTTIGLGAASAILLITQRNKLPGVLVGAGAVYSYTQYERERQQIKRSKAYSEGYRRGQWDARAQDRTRRPYSYGR